MPSGDHRSQLRDQSGLAALFDEAQRQLNICNSCRFCEGYCAVYPALERRTVLDDGDIVYLANLCHDCRACLYACMYAPPHEFGVNPPAILSKVRRVSYEGFTGRQLFGSGGRFTSSPRQRRALVFINAAIAIIIVLVCVALDHGLNSLYTQMQPAGSPYDIATYAAIVAVSLVLFGLSLFAMALGMGAYWRVTRGSLTGLFNLRAWLHALRDGATLRYLKGGAEGCYLEENQTSSERRILHSCLSFGFTLCLLATIVAAIEQDLANQHPPFPLLSVPVISGLVGGIGLVIGSIGLLRLKATQDTIAVDGPMSKMDRGFLLTLLALGVTGLATLLVRKTGLYGLLLAIHLSVVWSFFLLAPMTKFVHLIYRLLALVQDDLEAAAGNQAAAH